MKKKNIISANCSALLFVFCFSVMACTKENTEGTHSGLEEGEEMMSFVASFTSSKARFADDGSNSLVWSDYDAAGLFSYNTNNKPGNLNGFIRRSCVSPDSLNEGFAIFRSHLSRADWAGTADNITFTSYYPEPEKREGDAPKNVFSNGNFGYVRTRIPESQQEYSNSMGRYMEFGDHHFCVASATISRDDFLNKGVKVQLNYRPVESVISIRPYIREDALVDSVTATTLLIENTDAGSPYILGGTLDYNILTEEVKVGLAHKYKRITVNLKSATIKKGVENNDYINVVVLPGEANNCQLDFTLSYNLGANSETYHWTKSAPKTFKEGNRYKLDVEIPVYAVL